MFKENDAARELLIPKAWEIYDGTGVNILLLDWNGKILDYMKPFTVLVDPEGRMVNDEKHNTYTMQILHEFAPGATVYVCPWNFSKAEIEAFVRSKPKGFFGVANASITSPDSNTYDFLNELGIVTACAAGNEYDQGVGGVDFPARLPWTIAVGAEGKSYSNGGKMLNCVAPTDITVQRGNGKKLKYGGTSSSTPVVCALLARYIHCLKDKGLPGLTPLGSVELVNANCEDIGDAGFEFTNGYGRFRLPETLPSATIPTEIKMEGTMDGIDCSTKLTTVSAQALKNAGISSVGRYLGRTLWNGLTPDEVKAIHNAGLSLLLIWELAPTKKSYFTYAKGLSDANAAIAEAEYLVAPDGLAIYFAVDYDAQAGDMSAIVDYFNGVKDGLGGKYLLGVYGAYAVMQSVKADRYFQTYAWSGGKQFAGNHIYQYQNDVTLAGISVDRDYVNKNAGLWEVDDVLDVAVLLFTKEDYWAGTDVASKQGNCAMFIRPADFSVPKDAMSAKKLIVVGGSTTGHANEVLLSGNTKYDTAAAVKKYLG